MTTCETVSSNVLSVLILATDRVRGALPIALALIASSSPPAFCQSLYFNDFETVVGSEWSETTLSVTPHGGRRFLGEFANGKLEFNLSGLPTHHALTVNFDLFVIRSWDGNRSPNGPDKWRFTVDRSEQFSTTFSNIKNIAGYTNTQSYPNEYPGPAVPAQTGAAETNTLGYTFGYNPGGVLPSDSVYQMSFTFPHTSGNLSLLFQGAGLQGIQDESWGLDNIEVTKAIYWVGDQATVDGVAYPAAASFHHGLYWLGYNAPSAADGAVFQTEHPLAPVPNPGTINGAPYYIYFGDYIERRVIGDSPFIPGGDATVSALDIHNGNWTFDFSSPDGPVDGSLDVIKRTSIAFQGSAGLSPVASLRLTHGEMTSGSVTIGGVGAGRLHLDADATLSSPRILVRQNGKLTGTGTVNGNVVLGQGSGIGPGNSIGTLTVQGDVQFEPGSSLTVEIGENAVGLQRDQLVATGQISGTPTLEVALVNAGNGFQLPEIGGRVSLLTAANGVTATFQNASSVNSVAGGSLVIWSLLSDMNGLIAEAMSITQLPDGDYTGDRIVNAADYSVWHDSLGGVNLAADGNRNGIIDGNDFDILRAALVPRCDFDKDQLCDLTDLDLIQSLGPLATGVPVGENGTFDVNGDDTIDLSDRDEWLSLAAAANDVATSYTLGDADLDGDVDGSDFATWSSNKFSASLLWSDGDFTGDGLVDGLDFVEWNAHKFAAGEAVPEGALGLVGCWAMLAGLLFRAESTGHSPDARSLMIRMRDARASSRCQRTKAMRLWKRNRCRSGGSFATGAAILVVDGTDFPTD